MKSGAELIADERKRQIEEEMFDASHDDTWNADSEMAAAAISMIGHDTKSPPFNWPWAAAWWPCDDNRIRKLTKAGALIAAEIDRLSRIEERACKSNLGSVKVQNALIAYRHAADCFIGKVERGEARSRETYANLKEAVQLHDEALAT